MDKSPDAFRTISEVADLLETPAHVLRFWESRFPQIRPVKRAGGRRYYRPTDVALLAGIRLLLHDQGMTIRGVQKILREQGVRHVCSLAETRDLVSEAQAEWAGEDAVDLTVAAPAPAVPDDRVIAWPGPRPREAEPETGAAPHGPDSAPAFTLAPGVPDLADPVPDAAQDHIAVDDRLPDGAPAADAGGREARVSPGAPPPVTAAIPEPVVPDDLAPPGAAPMAGDSPAAKTSALVATDPAAAEDSFADMPLFRFAEEALPGVAPVPAPAPVAAERPARAEPAPPATSADDVLTLDEGSVAEGQATRALTRRLRALPPGRLPGGDLVPLVDGLRALRRQLAAPLSATQRH